MSAILAPGVLDELPLTALKGVGGQLSERLARLQIRRVIDLLLHLPLRYEDRTQLQPLAQLRAGEAALIQGRVDRVEQTHRGRRILLCRISDTQGSLWLRFFHFKTAQAKQFRPGAWVRAYGEVRPGLLGPEMVHPSYRLWLQADAPPPIADKLTPIYATVEGVSQARIQALIMQALTWLARESLPEFIPESALELLRLPDLTYALRELHAPAANADLTQLSSGRHPALRRVALEELTAHQLALRHLRAQVRQIGAPKLDAQAGLREALLQRLGFALTAAQRRVLDEILADLGSGLPMLRLVQGDVGSGKTAVAALAAAQTVASGYQAALMAPTELLAEQHWRNFQRWFEPLDIPVVWLSGKLKEEARRQAQAALADSAPCIAVGTHALFQEAVEFNRLGLVIIDEQHRFGVHQRLALRDKGASAIWQPHQLIMTATPIPRTLAMSAYADLDCSIIDELPPGRTPVTTAVLSENRRPDVVARVREACRTGAQVYWVCPLIEESEVLDCQAAQDTAIELARQLPELQVGLVHGRMKPAERDAVMMRFKRGELQLLVATTVIEVGVDVSNASLMIIENAERLGLSQLHQLRGRVGRGSAASTCLLLYQAPLSALAHERLAIMRQTQDGFIIAQRDLELRGPGELLGTRQTGELRFRVADLLRDADLLPHAQQIADVILGKHPDWATKLTTRWLIDADRYAHA